ncbi:Maf family protein, partial [Chloroflexota bacterium]
GMKTIILASASPRRKALLEKIGLIFEVEPSDYQEDMPLGLEPHDLARNISLEKARVIAGRRHNSVVIAADTFIVFDGRILGKPYREQDAQEMLGAISGKCHSVITGFSIIDTGEHRTVSKSVETKVYIRKLTLAEIDTYVKSGEPMDKAGAYAIQGLGSVFVEKIDGDYYNVVGFPLSALTEALKEFGINIL